jgi:hypothetical protein
MWLFTRYGFFSVGCAQDKNGQPDPNLLMIRARLKRHLIALKKAFKELKPSPIREDLGTDYRHRMLVPKPVWIRVLSQMAEEQEWSNFKNEVKQTQPVDWPYLEALHQVWDVMFGLQYHPDKSLDKR